MRPLLSRGLWLTVFLIPALVVVLNGGRAQDPPADPLPGLIKRLGSDVFAVRQDASAKLIAMGEKAFPALRKAAANHDDVEVRRRAQQLIQTILPLQRKSKATGLELTLIDGGVFQMGSPTSERNRRLDEDPHEVRIKDAFYLGVYEVTQEEYQHVMIANPSAFAPGGTNKERVFGQDTRRFPIDGVTWFDAIEFCNRLSKNDGLPEYYQIAEVKRDGNTIRAAKVTIAGGNGYRLPTEAEWEFACRAGSNGPYHFGKIPNTGREGNFKSSFTGGYGATPLWQPLNRTAKVGSYPGNDFGLFDMHGNVGEWCWDYYDKDYYGNSPRVDPRGPNAGVHRVCRGGSWLVTEASCRSASRLMVLPGESHYNTGFRVARNP